jgi:hypothetical protein
MLEQAACIPLPSTTTCIPTPPLTRTCGGCRPSSLRCAHSNPGAAVSHAGGSGLGPDRFERALLGLSSSPGLCRLFASGCTRQPRRMRIWSSSTLSKAVVSNAPSLPPLTPWRNEPGRGEACYACPSNLSPAWPCAPASQQRCRFVSSRAHDRRVGHANEPRLALRIRTSKGYVAALAPPDPHPHSVYPATTARE